MSPRLTHLPLRLLVVAALAFAGILAGCDEKPQASSQALTSPLDEPMDRPAPVFTWEGADGTTGRLGEPAGPVLVHFWATWCAPCVEELPALLAFARGEPRLRLLAISLDPHWKAVRDFFPKGVPPEVVRAQVNTDAAYRVSSLPETFLVDDSGAIRLRMEGERDWTDPAVRRAIRAQAGLD